MRLTKYVQKCLENHLQDGSRVLDATSGNGFDTIRAAQLIKPNGELVAIDIQSSAIKATKKKLTQAGLKSLCKLFHGEHGAIMEELTCDSYFDTIIFNLGYLPGSDKKIITTSKSTLHALEQSIRLLKTDGLLFVTAYRGHAGGFKESIAVAKWMKAMKEQPYPFSWHINEIQGNLNPNSPLEGSIKKDSPILWIGSKTSLNLPKLPLH